MTEAGTSALAAERIIRRAARAGNRLIAGSRVLLRTDHADHTELSGTLERMLTRMGARVTAEEDGPAPDFVFDEAGETGQARGASARDRIDWAAAHMPATRALAAELAAAGTLAGTRVAVSLVLEPKTAVLALALRAAGAEVAVFGAVSETDPRVAAALAGPGIRVFAPITQASAEEAPSIDAANAAAVLDWRPELLIDDGAHLIRLAHTTRAEALTSLRAASEETTSGVRPLREMQAEGVLRIPVIAVNDARTKTVFDNLIGTGQSCVFAIADALDTAEIAHRGHAPGTAGQRWVVIGYGPVGVGVARFAAALGARVTVVERDAVRALAALHDGHEALPAAEALPLADVVVSATGVWHTLDAPALSYVRPGAAVAVAGGIDGELALDDLLAAGWVREELTEWVTEWIPPVRNVGEIGLLVLAEGAGVNYTAAEGNPIEVMDLSFATQLASLEHLATSELTPGVHALPAEAEQKVARVALSARGGGADPQFVNAREGGAAQSWRVHRYQPAGVGASAVAPIRPPAQTP